MTHKGKLCSTGDSGYESHLQDAIKGLEDGTFLTAISKAARKVCCRLCNRGGTPLDNLSISGGTADFAEPAQGTDNQQAQGSWEGPDSCARSLLSGVVFMGLLESL